MIEQTTLWRDGSWVRALVNGYGESYVQRQGQTLAADESVKFAAPAPKPIVPAIIGEVLPKAPFVAGSETSYDAAVRQESKISGDEARILRLLKREHAKGCTCDEAEAILGLLHQTCAARFRGLELANRIIKTTRKRATRTGSKAVVYTLAGINQDGQAELGI